jgi:hypothetical protein
MKKAPDRKYRLQSAKDWIKTYSGNSIVKGYSKKYFVDKICAVKELRLLGVEISDEYESQLRQSLESLKQQRLSFKKKRENELNAFCEFESDENFAMIIGYTSGGYPYGVTHEEMEKIDIEKEFD